MFLLHVAGFGQPRTSLEGAGAFGVCVFFLLSAFLITTLLLLEKESTGTVHMSAFYGRRALRIWPLYYLCLLLCRFLDPLLPFGRAIPHAGSAFALFVGNWSLGRHGWTNSPLDPLWTVSVEEQFYLLVPLIIRFASTRMLVVFGAATIGVSYCAAFLLAPYTFPMDPPLWCNSFFQFQFFAAGMLLALWLRHRPWSITVRGRIALIAGALGAWWASLHGSRPTQLMPAADGLWRWLLVLLGVLLLFLAVFGLAAIPRWLTYLGKISYGLYLFHAFVLYLVYGRWLERLACLGGGRIVLSFAMTLAAAALSYEVFEKKFLLLKERFTFVASRPA